MSEILSFSIDYYKILEEDDLITLIQLKPVITGGNRLKTYFSLDAVKNAEPTLYNKPIICIWNNNTSDFIEHARTSKQKEMQDCVGCIPETNNSQLLEEENGETAQYINAAIWKHYFPNVALKLNDNKTTKISMEISVEKSHKRDDGFLEIDEFKYVGFTLLGENIVEAVPNAEAKIIKYSTSEYSDMVDTTNKQLSQFSIPYSIKENTKKVLGLFQENPHFVNFAEDIINNESLSFSKVNGILNIIQELKEDELVFFGGIETKEWCENIILTFNNKEKEEEDLVSKELQFSLNSDQIREIFRNALSEYKYIEGIYEYNRYYVECYDTEYVFLYDYKDQKIYRMTYQITNNIATIDMESAQQVISGGYMLVGEYSNNNDLENKLQEMSLKYEEMSEKYSVLEQDTVEKYALLETLKQFKADTEKDNLQAKADELYSKYESYISDEDKVDLNVKLFSVDNFDAFKEKVFAIVTPKIEAENIALKESNKNIEDDPNKIQFSVMPILDSLNKDENKSSLDKLKEYVNS